MPGRSHSHQYVLNGNRYWIWTELNNDSFETAWECSTCENQSKIESIFTNLDAALAASVLAINEHDRKNHP
jgi:hypothetical protein